jgi:hypothetical protein
MPKACLRNAPALLVPGGYDLAFTNSVQGRSAVLSLPRTEDIAYEAFTADQNMRDMLMKAGF